MKAIRSIDTSWRMDGCNERCRIMVVSVPGRRFTERLAVHDPFAHEAYGEHVLAREYGLLHGEIVQIGPLVIDGPAGTVSVDGEPLHVATRDMGLLTYLANKCGQLCTYRELLAAVWGPEYVTERHGNRIWHQSSEGRMVRSAVARLRSHLGAASGLLVTISGVGLRLESPEAAEKAS